MVYRGSLQTDDPRDAPKLVRMSPLRSSRSINSGTNSRAATSFKSPVYQNSYATPIDANRARLIEERRLGRERDIESVEKVIMRTTGIKIGAPKLRNISQIRETVFVDQSATPIDKIGKSDWRSRPKSVAVGLEESNTRRTHNSLLADLKDLERLRTTPPAQKNQKYSSRTGKSESKSTISNKKNETATSAKIRSDIFKIQQMFQSVDSSSRNVIRNGNDRKIKSDSSREEKGSTKGSDINRTRLLAQKLLEASRGNRDSLKERCNNPKNTSNRSTSKDANYKTPYRVLHERIQERESQDQKKEKDETDSEDQPRPPVRRRRNSKNRDFKDTNYCANEHWQESKDRRARDPDRLENSSNTVSTEGNSRAGSNLERPDILDGLLKESNQQLTDLQNDFCERGRSRSHWRGFVQSMRLHDVELHSDSEDQRKGKFLLNERFQGLIPRDNFILG